MKKATRKRYKNMAMRALIADAVAAVISRENVANVSIDMIAQEAGLSKGGIFYYYPTKAELMLSVLERHIEQFSARRLEIMETLPDTPASFVKATFTALFEATDFDNSDQLYVAKLMDVPGFSEAMFKLKTDVKTSMCELVENPENITIACVLYEGIWGDSLLRPHFAFRDDQEMIKNKIWELVDALQYKKSEEKTGKQ